MLLYLTLQPNASRYNIGRCYLCIGAKLSKFFKRAAKGCIVWVFLLALLAPATAYAATYQVDDLSDWYFYLDSTQEVTIYGNSDQSCSSIDWETTGTDPYLFLYEYNPNGQDTYLTEDDDAGHDEQTQCVSSKIVTTLDEGVYRIRAGYWDENSGSTVNGGTGNPEYTQDWGDLDYTIVTDLNISETVQVGPPMNLTITDSGNSITLDWDAPNTGIIPVERYAISWRIPPNAGWGVSTGNVGDANALNTEITIPYSSFESTGGLGETYVFDVRSDNDTLGFYSGWSTQVSLEIGPSDTDGDGVMDPDETEGCINDIDCDDDGTGDLEDTDDLDPDVPVLTVDTDGDGVFDAEEEDGCGDNVDCDGDGTNDAQDPDDADPDVPVLTVDTDDDGVFDAEETEGCEDDEDCDDDGTGDLQDTDDLDPDVPNLTVDTDGDGVFDQEETEGCIDDTDCDDDGTDDFHDIDDLDPDVPVLTVDTDGDGVFDAEEENGEDLQTGEIVECRFFVDCDFDGTGDFDDPDDHDADVPVWTIDNDGDGEFDKGEEEGCELTPDCDGDGTGDLEDPDDYEPDVPVWTIDNDGDGVFDRGEEAGCVWDIDCDDDGTGDLEDPDDYEPDIPVWTIDSDGDFVFDRGEEFGCEDLVDCDFDGTFDFDDPDDFDPDVPFLTIDSDGDLVFDQEEFEQCIENPDCDFDGIEDFQDIDPLDPDSPFLTVDSDEDGVFDAEEEFGCEFIEDCDDDGFTDDVDPDPLDPDVPVERVLIDGEEVEFSFVDEETGEELSSEEFFEEFEVAEEDEELALELNSLGIDIEDVDLSEVDDAEEKIIEALDELDEELAEDFLDVVDGEVTEEEIQDLFEDEEAFETLIEENEGAIAIIVDAVNEADDSVKEEFEEEVNIFEDEAYNEYVAAGSNIDTEDRRVIVAAAATATVAAAAARPAPPTPLPPPPPATPTPPPSGPSPAPSGPAASAPAASGPSVDVSSGGGDVAPKKSRRFGRRRK